jgi:hypothetical protein
LGGGLVLILTSQSREGEQRKQAQSKSNLVHFALCIKLKTKISSSGLSALAALLAICIQNYSKVSSFERACSGWGTHQHAVSLHTPGLGGLLL